MSFVTLTAEFVRRTYVTPLPFCLYLCRTYLHWRQTRSQRWGRTCAELWSCCWRSAWTASCHTWLTSSRWVKVDKVRRRLIIAAISDLNELLSIHLLIWLLIYFPGFVIKNKNKKVNICKITVAVFSVHVAEDPGPGWKCCFGGLRVLADFGRAARV